MCFLPNYCDTGFIMVWVIGAVSLKDWILPFLLVIMFLWIPRYWMTFLALTFYNLLLMLVFFVPVFCFLRMFPASSWWYRMHCGVSSRDCNSQGLDPSNFLGFMFLFSSRFWITYLFSLPSHLFLISLLLFIFSSMWLSSRLCSSTFPTSYITHHFFLSFFCVFFWICVLQSFGALQVAGIFSLFFFLWWGPF